MKTTAPPTRNSISRSPLRRGCVLIRIAIVASAMVVLSGCANQGGDQVRSIPSTTDYASEPIPSTTIPGNTSLGTPPMLPAPSVTGR